ncbi:hypothetical protein MHBO_001223 [Bonamia ostreae]|uniref:6-cysteine protein n=1 Tax=Bonamia ostreae TaxID=126728 RepID=A0ABV2AI91_9EUKA
MITLYFAAIISYVNSNQFDICDNSNLIDKGFAFKPLNSNFEEQDFNEWKLDHFEIKTCFVPNQKYVIFCKNDDKLIKSRDENFFVAVTILCDEETGENIFQTFEANSLSCENKTSDVRTSCNSDKIDENIIVSKTQIGIIDNIGFLSSVAGLCKNIDRKVNIACYNYIFYYIGDNANNSINPNYYCNACFISESLQSLYAKLDLENIYYENFNFEYLKNKKIILPGIFEISCNNGYFIKDNMIFFKIDLKCDENHLTFVFPDDESTDISKISCNGSHENKSHICSFASITRFDYFKLPEKGYFEGKFKLVCPKNKEIFIEILCNEGSIVYQNDAVSYCQKHECLPEYPDYKFETIEENEKTFRMSCNDSNGKKYYVQFNEVDVLEYLTVFCEGEKLFLSKSNSKSDLEIKKQILKCVSEDYVNSQESNNSNDKNVPNDNTDEPNYDNDNIDGNYDETNNNNIGNNGNDAKDNVDNNVDINIDESNNSNKNGTKNLRKISPIFLLFPIISWTIFFSFIGLMVYLFNKSNN